ncbi:hypothetical protein [Capnocytophaga sputigena]|jgi:hypothetical protein|uniref:hypothetical protein n=1 Tax=Capnocytophaga sputigena TaxID=1019 RepID=UPI0028E53A3F|nr:hypothetical protein [Capnocytophaga sputigena]
MKKIIFFSFILFCVVACGQKHKQNIEAIKQQVKKQISQYQSFPNYSIQVNKGGCRVDLIGNGMPLYTFFEVEGMSSGTISFNGYILKSGTQQLKVKVYPAEGKTTLDDNTYLTIEILKWNNERDPISERLVLKEASLPDKVKQQKLKYYELIVDFDAQVPYDFSQTLTSAETLSTIPNIENKVLDTYKKIYSWLKKEDIESLADFYAESNIRYCLVFYLEDELLEDRFDYKDIFKPKQKVDPFPDKSKYKMVFYADGKLVRLERIKDHSDILTLSGKDSDGTEVNTELNVLLYMPKGSNEFKQF